LFHGVTAAANPASNRPDKTKVDGTWLFAERILYVDWIEERDLS
jgi:hypothetical protein